MESFGIPKKIIEFQKSSFDNAFETIARFQDQTHQTMESSLGAVPNVPEHTIKAYSTWVTYCKQGRQTMKTAIDGNFTAWLNLAENGDSFSSKEFD